MRACVCVMTAAFFSVGPFQCDWLLDGVATADWMQEQ